jgi:hypothetical protein
VHDVVANHEHALPSSLSQPAAKGPSVTDTGADVLNMRDEKAVDYWDNPTDRYKVGRTPQRVRLAS